MILKKLALVALCVLLVSCNNAFLLLLDNNSEEIAQNKYMVIFDRNGGDKEASPGRKAVISPATTVVTLPAPPERKGYSFSGWNTQADGSGTIFTAVTIVAENMTVYAQWRIN